MQVKVRIDNVAKVTDNNSVMLNTSELLFDKVISDIEDYAIFLLDENGYIQTWNKGAETIKGYSEDEIIGKHFSTFYLQEDKESGLPEKLLNEAISNGKAQHEGWRVGKDDDSFWAHVTITALTDDIGNNIGFIKVTRDLSERVAAENVINDYEINLTEQALKTSNIKSMYQHFVNEVEGYAIIMLNKDGFILDWNKGAERMKGHTEEEVIGKHFSIFYREEDRKAVLPESLLYKAKQYGRIEHEGWRLKANGSKFWANVVITAIYNEINGDLVGFTKITRDRTAKKLEEDEKELYIKALEEELNKIHNKES